MSHTKEKNCFEITFTDTGQTYYWSQSACVRHFGRYEFEEVRDGYFPHIACVDVTGEVEPEDGACLRSCDVDD